MHKVRTLVDEPKTAGYHNVLWDGRDSSGNIVPSGVYIYRIVTGTFQDQRKLMLIR